MPSLFWIVRKRLKKIARSCQSWPDVLDVGGRKSHYTIGVPARITISDLSRETEIQKTIRHGLIPEIMKQLQKRRSNLQGVVLDDMTQSRFPDHTFDCVTAIEVLEHVEDDALFVRQVCRILKPGGIFLMTTPNGDQPSRSSALLKTGFRRGIPLSAITKRWYTREHLRSFLSSFFETVEVDYGVAVGKFHSLGLRSWSIRHPVQTALSMTGNFINAARSNRSELNKQALNTRHLIAEGRKAC